MIAVEEAQALIARQKKHYGIEQVELLQSLNRILAEDIVADRNLPPYNRATMDGFAINTSAFIEGKREFYIEKIQAAGQPEQALTHPGNCIEIMTGAMLPQGTNAVVPYEEVEVNNTVASVNVRMITAYQNVHLQGTDAKAGTTLLPKNTKVSAAGLGILASVGKSKVSVYKLPRVAICSTGDELVEVDSTPEAHQVRKSNVHMLAGALLQQGITASCFHLYDDKASMLDQLKSIMNRYDVLLFSGAVSKGKFDFLPEVLSELGLQTIFHRVAQKPGKPFLFGVFPNGPVVFGFPGNPASTFVCYHVYFKPWLQACLQQPPLQAKARLMTDVVFKPALSYHILVVVSNVNATLEALPVGVFNSGDMPGLVNANGIISLPAYRGIFKAGELFDVLFCE